MTSANKPWNSLPRPVVVAILGGMSGKRHVPATLIESGTRHLMIQMETDLPFDTALKIEVDGGLVLGSVTRSHPHGTAFLIHIEIDQVVPDSAGLARLVSAILGEKPPASIPYTPYSEAERTQPSEQRPVLRPSPR